MRKKSRRRKQTDIEKLLAEILEEEGVFYIREHRLGTYNVDFFIPDCSLSLQADGGYWHSYCDLCPTKLEDTPKQRYQSLKDSACIAYHRRFRNSIMRFCECEIKDNKEFVRRSILDGISEIKKGNLIYRKRKITKEQGKKDE